MRDAPETETPQPALDKRRLEIIATMEWNRAMLSRARAEVMPETVGTIEARFEDLTMPIWMLLGYRHDPRPLRSLWALGLV